MMVTVLGLLLVGVCCSQASASDTHTVTSSRSSIVTPSQSISRSSSKTMSTSRSLSMSTTHTKTPTPVVTPTLSVSETDTLSFSRTHTSITLIPTSSGSVSSTRTSTISAPLSETSTPSLSRTLSTPPTHTLTPIRSYTRTVSLSASLTKSYPAPCLKAPSNVTDRIVFTTADLSAATNYPLWDQVLRAAMASYVKLDAYEYVVEQINLLAPSWTYPSGAVLITLAFCDTFSRLTSAEKAGLFKQLADISTNCRVLMTPPPRTDQCLAGALQLLDVSIRSVPPPFGDSSSSGSSFLWLWALLLALLPIATCLGLICCYRKRILIATKKQWLLWRHPHYRQDDIEGSPMDNYQSLYPMPPHYKVPSMPPHYQQVSLVDESVLVDPRFRGLNDAPAAWNVASPLLSQPTRHLDSLSRSVNVLVDSPFAPEESVHQFEIADGGDDDDSISDDRSDFGDRQYAPPELRDHL